MSIRLAHVSDLHAVADQEAVLSGRRSAETLRATLDAFAADGPPDALILTGDIADDATPAAYSWVADMCRGAAPITRWLAGNHDDPRAMEEPGLLPTGGATIGLWDYVPIATFLPGKHHGGVGADQLASLDALLTAHGDRYVVLGIHHPPLHQVCPHVDCQVEDAAALLEVIARHRCVRVVLSGHLHSQFEISRDGVQFLGAPSSWLQIEHTEEPHYVPNEQPPAGREVILGDDGSVTSRIIGAAWRPA